jgi:hypothetical protein
MIADGRVTSGLVVCEVTRPEGDPICAEGESPLVPLLGMRLEFLPGWLGSTAYACPTRSGCLRVASSSDSPLIHATPNAARLIVAAKWARTCCARGWPTWSVARMARIDGTAPAAMCSANSSAARAWIGSASCARAGSASAASARASGDCEPRIMIMRSL